MDFQQDFQKDFQKDSQKGLTQGFTKTLLKKDTQNIRQCMFLCIYTRDRQTSDFPFAICCHVYLKYYFLQNCSEHMFSKHAAPGAGKCKKTQNKRNLIQSAAKVQNYSTGEPHVCIFFFDLFFL